MFYLHLGQILKNIKAKQCHIQSWTQNIWSMSSSKCASVVFPVGFLKEYS